MGLYLVERYLPGITPDELARARERLRGAAAALRTAGQPVRYLGSTFVPQEESCFCQFEASSAELVERACRNADVPFARITEARAYPSESKEEQCAG